MSIIRPPFIVALLACSIVCSGFSPASGSALAATQQTSAVDVPSGHYTLDKAHSTIIFKVSHLGFSFYTASFSRFDATLDFDPTRLEQAKLTATIDATSLSLPAPPEGFLRELLGPKWLNADNFPMMSYRSTSITATGARTARVTGDFTLNGRNAPVTLDVTFNGGYPGMAGLDPQARVGFSAHGSLNRSEFGVANGIPPTGSTMGVGDQVNFTIETEFHGPHLADSGKPGQQ